MTYYNLNEIRVGLLETQGGEIKVFIEKENSYENQNQKC